MGVWEKVCEEGKLGLIKGKRQAKDEVCGNKTCVCV